MINWNTGIFHSIRKYIQNNQTRTEQRWANIHENFSKAQPI